MHPAATGSYIGKYKVRYTCTTVDKPFARLQTGLTGQPIQERRLCIFGSSFHIAMYGDPIRSVDRTDTQTDMHAMS